MGWENARERERGKSQLVRDGSLSFWTVVALLSGWVLERERERERIAGE